VTGIMQGYADAFHEANPGITVNIVYTGNYGQTYEAITTEIAGGGEGPHAAILAAVNVYSLIELGLIIPAQDFIDQMENGQEFIDGFFPAFMTPDVDGVYWAVPFQRSTAIFFYNKDMFRVAGLDPEQPPRNRLELLEDAQALTTDQVWGLSMPTEDGWLFQSFTIADGEDIYRGDPTQVYFDTPTAVGALEYIVSLSQEHKVMPAGVVTWGDASGDFLGEKVAMLYYSTGALTNILTNANFEVGVSFLPSGLPGEDGTGYGTPTGGGNIFLFDRGSEQERAAAWKWAQFLASPEIQADWGIQTGYIAANTEAWETDRLLEWVDLHAEYGVAREQLEFAQQELNPYQYNDVSKALTDALQSAITGEEEPAAALSRAQRLADSILEAYR
jgi:sn-glycerol 3-phosphate transport system substrate-binding protein